ncbi:hypothetical protein BGX38DRAFT_1330617 [Terfezia claveryi]|nr:hypothetical protein BGX38DRAFT_1334844 [Terfezia claveryi]KAF8446927.1 hypothetical protein BGX38DRAFT_1330617 [Terfezia claveryi]
MMVLDSPPSFVKHAISVDPHLDPSLDNSCRDTHSEASFQSSASSSDEPPAPNHPFYKLPIHPLILPSGVLNRKVKPVHFKEVWDAVNIKLFIIEVLGTLPTNHDYHEGIHICRTIFVSKYGFGRYMDNMTLFWGMFHDTYVRRDSDPHSASWSRWRYDRKVELEHVLCHSYVWGSDDGGSYLEEYINFKSGEPGRTYVEDQEYLRRFGAKVTRFEIGWIGIENCNPEWGEENVKLFGGLESTTSRRSMPQISSSRLSSEFALSNSSVSLGFTYDIPPFLPHEANGKTAAHQWESANHTHALNVFAARKHRTLTQNGARQETERAFSIHRSHSVWKELLLQRSHSSKKRVVSGPVHVTRCPNLGVSLLPIASPAPELSRKYQKIDTPKFNQAPHRSNILESDTESTLWKPVTLLPQSLQGSLYGQLEDLLVFSVNKFLKFQAASLTQKSIMKELEIMKRGYDCGIQPSEPSDKTWFRQLRGRFGSVGKARNCLEHKSGTLLNSHEWGVKSGYRLTLANFEYTTCASFRFGLNSMLTVEYCTRTLQFHGDHAANPTNILKSWSQLIIEAFSGRRTTFDDSTVMRHVDHVESILDLLGDLAILRRLGKKKHEIRLLLKQEYRTATGITEGSPSFTDTPQKRISILPSVRFPPTRSSSFSRLLKVNRPRSMNSRMNAVWSEFGGSYATTPSLPPLDAADIKDSPCYGKGKGRARVLNKANGVNPTRTAKFEEDTLPDQDTEDAWRKETERANACRHWLGNNSQYQ